MIVHNYIEALKKKKKKKKREKWYISRLNTKLSISILESCLKEILKTKKRKKENSAIINLVIKLA